MIYRNEKSDKFYRMVLPAGAYPDQKYRHWILWQPVKRWFWLFWIGSGEKFWLDIEGFYPLERIHERIPHP